MGVPVPWMVTSPAWLKVRRKRIDPPSLVLERRLVSMVGAGMVPVGGFVVTLKLLELASSTSPLPVPPRFSSCQLTMKVPSLALKVEVARTDPARKKVSEPGSITMVRAAGRLAAAVHRRPKVRARDFMKRTVTGC